jgi:hypothetical protein
MAVPTSARAQAAIAAIATIVAPITVAIWDEFRSLLEIVTNARGREEESGCVFAT